MAKATRKLATKKEEEAVKTVFNPEKRYKWTPEDKFELSGVEFALMLNQVLERKQKLLQELEITSILENKLKIAVETGVAIEITEAAK